MRNVPIEDRVIIGLWKGGVSGGRSTLRSDLGGSNRVRVPARLKSSRSRILGNSKLGSKALHHISGREMAGKNQVLSISRR